MMRWQVKQRVDFIGRCLERHGRVNRSDLVAEYGISVQQASADLTLFHRLHPGAMEYDKRKKTYKATTNGKELTMANVFEGTPDDRQANTNIPVSRFRPAYRALSDEEKALHDEIKSKAVEMENLYKKVCGGRYNSLALTSLEESVMWIVKELTGQGLNPNTEPKNDSKAA